MLKPATRLWLGAGCLLLAVDSQATYQVYCNSSFQATPITSTFGEPRQDAGWTRPNRFHAGVDITGQCSAAATVKPIEGGKAYLGSAACEDQNACIRVVNQTTGHAFDYEHVTPSIADGAIVTTATIIGTIQNLGTSTHLHLNEIIRVGNQNFRVNPQFQNRLDYLDNDRPTFVSVTVGSESDQVVIVKPGTDSSPVTFRKRSGNYYVSGQATIFATARNGSSRKGLFSVSSDADPIRLVGASAALPTGTSLGFNYLVDGASDPNDVQRIYWKRHANPGGSITFIPTNLFLGGISPQAASGRWDTALGFQGPQEVCATAVDHPQPNAHSDTTFPCADVVVDNTGPTINMSNAGGTVADGGATSTATITIAPTDSGGIYSITVAGVSYSSTNYPSDVQTAPSNTFPDSGTLADGSYTVTVIDLADNQASASFTIWRKPFLDEGRA